MILIISDFRDPTARKIKELILEAGCSCRLIDLDQFPSRDCICYKQLPGSGAPIRSFRWNDECIDLGKVRSILWRRPSRVQAPASWADAELREYVSVTLRETITGVFENLECLQVPASRHVLHGAHVKIPQLVLAGRLGFELPVTLVTNDPDEFLCFYREHEGRLIIKPVGVFAEDFLKGAMCGFARLLAPRELIYFRDLQICPVIAQVYVDKRLEIRATVVGSDVFAVEIHSQSARRTLVDWRNYDESKVPHYPHVLPDEVAGRCLSLVHELGLVYGAIDLILTPEGKYVFLEINPSGQYQWLEEMTGLPISKRLAKLLIEGI